MEEPTKASKRVIDEGLVKRLMAEFPQLDKTMAETIAWHTEDELLEHMEAK